MVKKALVGILLLVIVLTGLVYYFYPVTDKDLVERNFSNLSYYVDKAGTEGATKMAYKANMVATLFNNPCGLDVPHSFLAGSYTQSQITSNAAQARSRFKNVTLKFYDIQTEILGENEAKSVFTARLTGNLKSGNTVDETREMVATLKKVEGKWLFTNFKLVEVLQR